MFWVVQFTISTTERFSKAQEISQDLPRPKRFPKGKVKGKSRKTREIWRWGNVYSVKTNTPPVTMRGMQYVGPCMLSLWESLGYAESVE